MLGIVRKAFFLDVAGTPRFCLLTEPQGPSRGGVVHVHAFAEEMNKSRRMVTLGAQAFAQAGWSVLQIDLFGCGDSDGEFGEATWQTWRDDVIAGLRWMSGRGAGSLWLWGLRTGCLLAGEVLTAVQGVHGLLCWQPVWTGRTFLTQFLRLRMAADLANQSSSRVDTKMLNAQLEEGVSLEIAGYELSPSVAAGLNAAVLKPVPGWAGHIISLEVNARADAELSPASSRALDEWRAAGLSVGSRTVPGISFWQTQEIEECPLLIKASLEGLA